MAKPKTQTRTRKADRRQPKHNRKTAAATRKQKWLPAKGTK
jgi:hypothetical protein